MSLEIPKKKVFKKYEPADMNGNKCIQQPINKTLGIDTNQAKCLSKKEIRKHLTVERDKTHRYIKVGLLVHVAR